MHIYAYVSISKIKEPVTQLVKHSMHTHVLVMVCNFMVILQVRAYTQVGAGPYGTPIQVNIQSSVGTYVCSTIYIRIIYIYIYIYMLYNLHIHT